MALERLDPRLVGEQPLLVAAPEQHRRALGVHAPRELAEQRRLADPRLAGRDGDPQRAGRRVVPRRAQPRERRARGPRAARCGRAARAAASCAAGAAAPTRPRRTSSTSARVSARGGTRSSRRSRSASASAAASAAGRSPAEREQPDQVAVRGLAERLVLDARARASSDRRGELARPPRRARRARERRRDVGGVLVARPQDPVGVEPGEQLAARRRPRTPRARLRARRRAACRNARQVDLRAQLDALARGHDRLGRRERAPQLVDRVAQGLARALLGDVGPQQAGQPRAGVRAGVDREPRQQLARAGVGGQRDGRAVDRRGEAAEDADENVMGQSCSTIPDPRAEREGAGTRTRRSAARTAQAASVSCATSASIVPRFGRAR